MADTNFNYDSGYSRKIKTTLSNNEYNIEISSYSIIRNFEK